MARGVKNNLIDADSVYTEPEPGEVPFYQAESEAPTVLPADDLVERRVYDMESDAWVKRLVPRITDIVEPADRADGDYLDTSSYDPEMYTYWGSTNPSHPSNIELRMKGYAPVRNWQASPYQKRNVDGIGKVITMGDLTLWEAPREMVMRRKAREAEQRRNDEQDRLHGPMEEFRGFAQSEGAHIIEEETEFTQHTNSLEDEYGPGVFSEQIADGDFATQAAVQASKMLQAQRGTRSYAGFNGPMGKGVPQSPFYRGK